MSIDLADILPPQLKNAIWQVSPTAIKNTMTYIFDILRHPCYLIGIRDGKVFFYKIVPGGGTAPAIIPALKNSLATLHKNRHMTSQQIADIKRGVDIHDTRIMQCILKTFAEKPEKLNEYYRLLSHISQKLTTGVFILNLTDATILREDGLLPFPYVYGNIPIPDNLSYGPFLPIMGAGQKGYYDIPIPNYDEINRIVDNSFVDYLAVYEMDWNKKRGRAIFRGGPSGCGATAATNMRIALALKKHPLVDACIVGRGERVIKYDPKFGLMKMDQRDIGRALCHNQKGTPMTTQSGYKYIIHIDGNVNAYRLLGTMLTGSLILRVRSNYIHWADHLLKAGVHYIEISADLSNLNAVLEWCQKHDNKCQAIAAAGLQAAAMLIERPFIESVFIKYMGQGQFKPWIYSPHTPSFSPPAPAFPKSQASQNSKADAIPVDVEPSPLSPIAKAIDDPHSLSAPWPESPDYPPPNLAPQALPQAPQILANHVEMPKSGRCPRGYNRTTVNGVTLCKSKEEVKPPPLLTPIVQKVVAEVIAEQDKVLDDPNIIPLSGKRCPAGYGAVIIQTRKYCRRKRPMGGTKKIRYYNNGGNGGNGGIVVHATKERIALSEAENLKTVRNKETAIEIALSFILVPQ